VIACAETIKAGNDTRMCVNNQAVGELALDLSPHRRAFLLGFPLLFFACLIKPKPGFRVVVALETIPHGHVEHHHWQNRAAHIPLNCH